MSNTGSSGSRRCTACRAACAERQRIARRADIVSDGAGGLVLQRRRERPGLGLLLQVLVLHILHHAYNFERHGSGTAPSDVVSQRTLVREEALLKRLVHDHHLGRASGVPLS